MNPPDSRRDSNINKLLNFAGNKMRRKTIIKYAYIDLIDLDRSYSITYHCPQETSNNVPESLFQTKHQIQRQEIQETTLTIQYK